MIISRQEPCWQEAVPVSFQWHRERLFAPDQIAGILDKICFAMAGCLYADKEIFAVCLALEEALVNAIKHGHQGNTDKQVLIKYRVGPEHVLVVVKDRGTGFDPQAVPDPRNPENLERLSGRGLLLMQTYMTWVRHNARGNCVVMCKCRSKRPLTPAPTAWNRLLPRRFLH